MELIVLLLVGAACLVLAVLLDSPANSRAQNLNPRQRYAVHSLTLVPIEPPPRR